MRDRWRITITCTGAAYPSVLVVKHQPRRPGDVGRYPEQMTDDDLIRERLHFAASDGDLAAVKALIADGYDVNATDSDLRLTPLHYAARDEHLDVARYLIDHGANVNAIDDATAGDTPLADIAQECSYEMAELLLKAGANPLTPGWMQLNALHRSERRKRPEGVKVHELILDYARRRFHYAG